MTPMEQLKPQFDTLKTLMGANFKLVNLNKAPFKKFNTSFCGDVTEHVNKGVKSDFIRLIQISLNNHQFSLAFSFDYLNNPEKSTISFSCSDSYLDIKRYSKTVTMNPSELQSKMNSINNILKVSETISDDEILEVIQMELIGFDFLNSPQARNIKKMINKKIRY